MKIAFILINSVDLDKVLTLVAFHLGLHCLPKYQFTSFLKKGKVEDVILGHSFSKK